MTILEKMTSWLLSFPHWEKEALQIDYAAPAPENAGLFPQGLEELSRTRDVLGNQTVRNRLRFTLYRVTTGQQDNRQQSSWLLALQDWIQQQSALGLAPHFGDEPAMESIRVQQGSLKNGSRTGTGCYGVTIIAEFVKHYEKEI